MIEKGPYTTDKQAETAVLVSVITNKQSALKVDEYLNELAFLADTCGIVTLHKFVQRLDKPDHKTFVGKGKIEEIRAYVKHKAVNMVIFDDDLSPSQLRNIENELECKIFDRSLLILELFVLRAKTAQAKTQVELARLQYLLPRLTRMWTHLERQRGGTGTRGGSGEKEIETDKRVIRDKITLLKSKLGIIDKQNITQRKSRSKAVRVSLVGYTNVGKSTLMNLLSKADVFAENKLFATVDSTVRKVVIGTIPFLLTDTVGFIRKLPHTLIECFKSTLDEVREADILLHVVDVSHASFEEQIEVVNTTLAEIGAADKPTILVLNKIDLYKPQLAEHASDDEKADAMTLEKLKASYMNKHDLKTIFISAINKENIDELKDALLKLVEKKHDNIFPNNL
jgi:GTP-binding protein HflX